MVWGAIAGAAGGAAGGLLGGLTSARAAARENRRHREWNEKMLTHGPSWRVQGLKAAGLNPILAAGPGFAGTPSGPSAVGGGGASSTGAAQGYSAIRIAQEQARLLKSQRNLSDITAAKVGAEATTARYHAQAAELDPLIRYAHLTSAEEAALIAGAERRIRQAEVPRAIGKEKLFGDVLRELERPYDRLGGIRGIRNKIWEPQTSALKAAKDWLQQSEPYYRKIQRWYSGEKPKSNKKKNRRKK